MQHKGRPKALRNGCSNGCRTVLASQMCGVRWWGTRQRRMRKTQHTLEQRPPGVAMLSTRVSTPSVCQHGPHGSNFKAAMGGERD